jgi:hypothetical protein
VLETFTCATFEPYVGEPFLLLVGPQPPIEVVLVEATVLPSPPRADARAPFSLVFRQSAGDVLPQATYRVEHAGLGIFDLFVVPIGPDGQGMRYEAVFT